MSRQQHFCQKPYCWSGNETGKNLKKSARKSPFPKRPCLKNPVPKKKQAPTPSLEKPVLKNSASKKLISLKNPRPKNPGVKKTRTRKTLVEEKPDPKNFSLANLQPRCCALEKAGLKKRGPTNMLLFSLACNHASTSNVFLCDQFSSNLIDAAV